MYRTNPSYSRSCGMGEAAYGPTLDQLGVTVDAAGNYTRTDGSGAVFGPTLEQLGVTRDAAGNYVRVLAGTTVTAWLNRNATYVALGAALFVGLIVIGSGGRSR